ncbi:DUF3099 domain-containing protein [Aeromicrobium sp. CF4.19]|uniref:DUF3099 domain-containing protein n=1 Tax=Aeromicrobium sp. CF4.19 TaxID=3373082 RepID=UPI003EE77E75
MPAGEQQDPDRRRGEDKVYSITSASTGHSDELGAREIRYAISMAIRSVCFVGGVVVWQYQTWVGVVLLALAIFLPYTSVVLANAGVRTKASGSDLMAPEPHAELTDGPADDRPVERT